MKLVKALDAALTVIAMIAMAAIVISIILNVVLRSLFDAPLIWIVEVNGMLVVWLTFLVLGTNTSLKRHFKIEFVTTVASESTKRLVIVFKDLIVLITLCCMIWFTVTAIRDNRLITTSVTEVRVWIAYYLPAAIGSVHAVLVLIVRYASKSRWKEAEE